MEKKVLYLKIEEEKIKTKIRELIQLLREKKLLDKKNKIEKEKEEKLKQKKIKEDKKNEKDTDENKTYILIPLQTTTEERTDEKIKKENKTTEEELKKIKNTIKEILPQISEEKITFTLEEKNTITKPKSVKEILQPILKEKIKYLKSSFDILGRIAIIEETEELKEYNKKIAEAIMKIYKEVKSVYVKAGIHEGEYRIQPYSLVLGEEDSTTIYTENKIKLYLDIKKTYFTPRLANERLRIAEQIKKEVEEKLKQKLQKEIKENIREENKEEKELEKILVLFSGIAPYPITIEKKLKEKKIKIDEKNKKDLSNYVFIEGVELNPDAHDYAVKNLLLNKTKRIKLYNEDAKKFLEKKLSEKKTYDRILMPLPKHSKYFLLDAVKVIKNEGIIHFYYFEKEEKILSGLKKILEEELKPLLERKEINYEILEVHKVGQYAPRKYRVCADIKIYKK